MEQGELQERKEVWDELKRSFQLLEDIDSRTHDLENRLKPVLRSIKPEFPVIHIRDEWLLGSLFL